MRTEDPPIAWRIRLAAFLLAAAAATGGAADAPAGEQSGGIVGDVRVGLGGRFKLGHWTPVWITLSADDPVQGDLQITAPDGDDLLSTYTGGRLSNIRLGEGESRTIATYVRIGRRRSTLTIEWSGETSAETKSLRDGVGPAILATQQRVVVVGAPVGMAEAVKFTPRRGGEEIVATLIEDARAFPDRWQGYDGVDVLVLSTSELQLYDALTPAQRSAIENWVRLGGRAILCVGSSGERALANDSLPGRLAPGRWQRTLLLRETASLETMIDATSRLDMPTDDGPARLLLATQLRDVDGSVLLSAGGKPLVVQAAHGLGQVLFVGFDLDRPPISTWADRGRLVAKLLELTGRDSAGGDSQQATSEAAHLGFEDLSGQLRAGLDQFSGVRLVPFSWVAGLVMVYILLIGPADYFLLRWLGRMELTWVTFPLLAIALCGAAWLLADWSRGDAVRVNKIDVVDVDESTSLVRGTTWLRLYNPRNRRFDLRLETATMAKMSDDAPGMLLSWQGLPGESLGGMNDVSWGELHGQRYEIHNESPAGEPPQLEIRRLPMKVGATKGFTARWWSDAQLTFEHDLRYTSLKLLRGHVENPLPIRLTACRLYHDRWVYDLGTLEPGQRVTLDEGASPLDVKWMLTERTVIEARDVTTPWDRAMRDDVPRIVRIMMFHDAAGGRGYTGLMHRYEGFVDVSGHLSANRAVLVGRAEDAATELHVNGRPQQSDDDRQWTFYRIVLPTRPDVKQGD